MKNTESIRELLTLESGSIPLQTESQPRRVCHYSVYRLCDLSGHGESWLADAPDFQGRDFSSPRCVFSVLLVGVPFHLLTVRIEKRLSKLIEVPVSPARIRQLQMLSTVLMVVQVVVTFYATKLAYGWYFS
jgi:hypothetical protein